MQGRTPRNYSTRKKIVQYMTTFYDQHGRQPTVREIGAAAGLSSTSTTAGYLNRMVRDGILGKTEGPYRNYFVISRPESEKVTPCA